MLNYLPTSRVGSLFSALGRITLVTNPPVGNNNPTLGLVRFDILNATSQYIMASDATLGTTAGFWHAVNGAANWTSITIPGSISITAGQITYFQQYGSYMYGVNGKDTDFKIDSSFNLTPLQGASPTNTPSASAGAAGNLNGNYFYRATFANTFQETGAGPISAQVTLTNQQGNVSGLPTSFPDPQFTLLNLYRLGGTISIWELVHSGPLTDYPSGNFTDNVADQNLGVPLVITRDIPPQGLWTITGHKNRLWGFGSPTDPNGLWCSNYNEPWGWNLLTQYFPIGVSSVNDQAQAARSIGSLLILFKKMTTWAMFGDDLTSFIPRKLFDIGCVAPRSVVAVLGVIFWLASDGVWMFDGAKPTRVSMGIESIIMGLTQNDLSQATGSYFQGFYLLSLPTKGITYCISLMNNEIYKLGWASDNFYTDPSVFEITGVKVGHSNSYSWFGASTDLGATISSSFIGNITDSQVTQGSKRYRHGILIAPVQSGVNATITLTINPGLTQVAQTKSISLGSTIRNLWSIPTPSVGFQAQVQITTSATVQVEVQKFQVHGWVEREYV